MSRSGHVVALRRQADRHSDAGPAPPGEALTRFVGRSPELSELRELLDGVRLVTLVGPGGVGKSRLALQFASAVAEGPAYWTELGPFRERSMIERAILDAVGGPVQPDRSSLAVACAHLGDRAALLVVDNCEHVLEHCASAIETVLSSCPRARVIATSRAPLAVSGETTWNVPPLTLGPNGDAVRLFLDRARQVRPDFAAADDELEEVVSICRTLDGLPLAIELAAARTRALGVHQIAAELSDRFRLLTGGPRDAPARHRTLRASLAWSHDLLDDSERMLFARLAVFDGGWTLDAARAVCCDDRLEPEALLDVLTGLIEKSLVSTREDRGAVRYGMLETVRAYALEQLQRTADQRAVRDRHMAWFEAFAEVADREYVAMTIAGRARLEAEMPNLRAAIEHALDFDPEGALRTCAALVWYWRERGLYREGTETLDRVLDRSTEIPNRPRVRALAALALLVGYAGNFERNAQLDQQVAELAEQIADPHALAFALTGQGVLISFLDPAMGRPVLERAVVAAHESGHRVLLGDALMWLVVGASLQEDLASLERRIEETLSVTEPLEHRQALAWCGWAQSIQALARGMPSLACEHAQRILEPADVVQEPITRSMAIRQLATAAAMTGEPERMRGRVAAERERFESSGTLTAGVETELACAELELATTNATAARERVLALLAPGMLLVGHQRWQAHHLLAQIALIDQDIAAAHQNAQKIREHGLANPRALALADLIDSRAELLAGDDERAEALAHQALAVFAQYGWVVGAIDALEQLGVIAHGQGSAEHAARLLSAAKAARQTRGLVRHPLNPSHWDLLEARILTEQQSEAIKTGADLALDDAVAYTRRGRGPRDRPLTGWSSLTPTEVDVAMLAAQGASNVEIAQRLFMSRSTVKHHLAHVYTKLNIAGRTQLAAMTAARNQER